MILSPLATVSSRENHTDSWRIQKPTIHYDACIRCMICWKFCPDNAIDIVSDPRLEAANPKLKKLEAPLINMDYCKGCGICANECPTKCIEMSLEEKRGI